MTLGELLRAVTDHNAAVTPELDARTAATTVTGIAYDSRRVTSGTVFVALRGMQSDGTTFAEDAITRGASAIVSETPAPAGTLVRWIRVGDARNALAALASEFWRHPSESLTLVGITGTNGKTTTSYVLASIFEAAGVRCGRIGTVGYRIGDRETEAARTTPEAPELQHMLREMVSQGCGACVMEVSSHALALKRADHLRFSAAVFTNLTRDHLDFHRDMEAYFQAKLRLFELLPSEGFGVTNLDDRRGAAFAAAARRPVTYAIDAAADVTPVGLSLSLDGVEFQARTPRGTLHVRSRLVGRPNAYNILAALSTAMALDVPFGAIEHGIWHLASVPGRFQLVSGPTDDVRVVVDYAHTDDALKNLLETARPLASGRVVTIFGCGGDRDRTKRPLMGAVAARLSDLVVITSDNPRSESPAAIIEDVKRGIVPAADRKPPNGVAGPKATPHLVIVDRREAIDRTIADARRGDLVLIAGKGHEKYQVIGDRVLPFDDVDVAQAALTKRRTGTRVS
ncbi:MAG: UDP-N-acetylmuramoyl-L-alanyl-D-glutamate--2,6-diaminopimelate ligase [Vicinamibacterales bacterium]